jgi:hypothetical protein
VHCQVGPQVDLTRALAADGGRLRQLGGSQSRADADRDLHGRGPLRLEVTHGSMRAVHASSRTRPNTEAHESHTHPRLKLVDESREAGGAWRTLA